MGNGPALFLADTVLALHLLIVLCNILVVPLIIIGGIAGWRFVKLRWFRFGHLALMGFIAIQSWLGETCPLTVWERHLRIIAGEQMYKESFMRHWMRELLYIDAPPWFFIALYSGWCLLIAALFYFVPVERKSRAPVSIQG